MWQSIFCMKVEGYGNNLYTSGTFIETNHGVYEIGW